MTSSRETLDLCGPWRLQPDPSQEGEATGYHRADFDTRLWREAWLPATFEHCLPSLASYEGACWFRRSFEVARAWRGKRVALHFEGVNYHASVWVNGQEVGAHEDGFLPFEFPVHDLLRYGEPNCVTVRVDNIRREGEVPGRQRGWRPYGGILREVTLIAGDHFRISGLSLRAEPEGAGGRFLLRGEITNGRGDVSEAELTVQIGDTQGRTLVTLSQAGLRLESGRTQQVELEGVVEGVTPWSPDRPALYQAVVDLRQAGRTVDQQRVRFGFRRIEARGEKLVLNGEPVFLRGLNRHEDSPHTNMATDLRTARRDLVEMKQMGANFVRLCHYPHHPGELDLCDQLGLLVMCEIPLYWWHGLAEGEENCARKLEAAKRQLAKMIARDRSHPSVIFWSVSNETEETRPEVAEGNAALVRLAKSLDPTRLAVHVSDRWPQEPHFEEDDVICVNGYPSWGNRWRAEGPPYDFGESGRWWREHLAALHSQCPGRPILVTEFGYPCLDGVFGSAIGEEAQAAAIEAEARGLTGAYVCGAVIWCYADHPWPEEEFISYLTTSPFGVVSRTRRRKLAFGTVQRIFSERAGLPTQPAPGAHVPGAADPYLVMIRPNLEDIPEFPFPEGYSMRPMRPGEDTLWTDIQRDAERIIPITEDLFEMEFGTDLRATLRRCFFIVNDDGVAVGTISAWYSRDFRREDHGRIHWFAIRPAYRGRGLARPALSFALQRLAEWHERAWLDTSASRLPAIKLYLDFGFLPDLEALRAREAWAGVRAGLDHPALRAALGET